MNTIESNIRLADQMHDTQSLQAHPKHFRQFRINEICLVLNQFHIRNKPDLYANLDRVMRKIGENPSVFKNFDASICFEIFAKAVLAYQDIQEIRIHLIHQDRLHFYRILESIKSHTPRPADQKDEKDPLLQDLGRITKNYDRLETAIKKVMRTSSKLEELFKSKDFAVISHVIFGLGDAGTSLWLEKCSAYHQKAGQDLAEGKLPEVIIMGQTLGNMRCNYTLAQTHNVLERGEAKSNPNDYISVKNYQTNPYLNARHLHQSNMVNLAKTDAPVMLGWTVVGIEKRENHLEDWQSQEQDYRLRIKTSSFKEKLIYTNELDICTGLGYAKKEFLKDHINPIELEKLSEIDEEKQFHPIIDGDQYLFTYSEDKSTNKSKRRIVIFGGGDTSAAAYRKAYFGQDFCLKEYSEENRKHDVFWLSSYGFERAGRGKLPKEAVESAKNSHVLYVAMLRRIDFDPQTKKLSIYFNLNQDEQIYPDKMSLFIKVPGPHKWVQGEAETVEKVWYKIECDQFIFSIGQDSEDRRQLCRQVKDNVELDILAEDQIPLGMRTKDNKIHFLGAAAQTMGGKMYADAMFKWIKKTMISEDSASPAVLPPSRALIKMHAVIRGAIIQTVNVNMDDPSLIRKLCDAACVNSETREKLINAILTNRKRTESGMTTQQLQEILNLYELNDLLFIKGHSLLCQKQRPQTA